MLMCDCNASICPITLIIFVNVIILGNNNYIIVKNILFNIFIYLSYITF